MALENQPIKRWTLPALTESDPKRALTALMALARVADAKVHPQVVARLNDLPWEGLALEWQLVALQNLSIGIHPDGRRHRLRPAIDHHQNSQGVG